MAIAAIEEKSKVKNGYLYQDTPFLQYYQFPEFLLRLPVSQTAKILYMVLYDRARLSQRNHWIDDDGRIYLVYPVIELAAKTGRSVSAVKAGLNELLQAGLLEKVRVGFGKPNRLYVRIPFDFSPSERLDSDPDTAGKPAPKQMNRVITQRQNAWSSYRSFPQYTGKRAGAFENYNYDGEDSF